MSKVDWHNRLEDERQAALNQATAEVTRARELEAKRPTQALVHVALAIYYEQVATRVEAKQSTLVST